MVRSLYIFLQSNETCSLVVLTLFSLADLDISELAKGVVVEFVHNNEPRLGLVTKVDKMCKSAEVQLMNKEEDGWTEEEECVAFDEIVRLFQHECVKCSAYLCGECETPIYTSFIGYYLTHSFSIRYHWV